MGTNERGPTGGPIGINLSNPSTIYAGVRGRVYVSTDGGESWTEAAIGLPESGVIKQLVLDSKNSSALYAGSTRGLWELQRP